MSSPNAKWQPAVSDTLDNAAAVNKGGGLVGLPITGHAFQAQQIVTIAGSVHYNGSFKIISKTTNEIVITATYSAETCAGTETVVFSKQPILKSDFTDIEVAIAALAATVSAMGLVEPVRDVSGLTSTGSTFTGLTPGAKYRLDFEGVKASGSSDNFMLRFNGKTSGYDSQLEKFYSSGSPTNEGGTTGVWLTGDTTNSGFVRGSITFWSIAGDNTFIVVHGESSFLISSTRYAANLSGTSELGASPANDLTSATFLPVSGTFTGRISLYRVA